MFHRHPRPVVCALIERDGRVLLARRPAGGRLGLKWEFPGGKVDDGETPGVAVLREIREELACEVTILRTLPRSTHDYGDLRIEMIPFICQLAPDSSEPRALEHAALAWVRPEALADYDLAAADRPVLRAYLTDDPA